MPNTPNPSAWPVFASISDDIGQAIEQGLASNRPTVLEFITDPEVPPLPPHITFEQAVHFWKSVFKGDVSKWGMIKQSFKDMVENYVPHGT